MRAKDYFKTLSEEEVREVTLFGFAEAYLKKEGRKAYTELPLKNPFEFNEKLHREFHRQYGFMPYSNSNNKEQLLQYIIWLEGKLLEKTSD